MTEVQRLAKIMVLKDMLKEYELLAKYNGGTDYDRWKALDMAIKALEQEPKWIPVSERLPEKATRVLTSWVYVPTGAKYIEVAERWGDDDDYTFYGDTDEYKMNRKDHKVIAWMPLVEPYKAESEAQDD